jgi:tungstate transport system ATP-binding protein
VLMGRNGSGKSTLLRICALLENPENGTVAYVENDTPLQPDMPLRRRITLVLPRIGVFNTTVYRNVAYPLRIRGLSHDDIESRVNKTLVFVGLERKKNQQAKTLSSGETQRLGMARALVLDPDILFLDEPTASIDEENTRIIESIIKDMRKEGKAMVIMTTHDNAQAERIADRVLVLEHGVFQPEKSV